MNGLTLQLLGTPVVMQDGRPITGFRSIKSRALLFYVTAHNQSQQPQQPQPRTKLAGLLWGDLPDANANANLRKTLTNLRRLVGAYLTITRHTVGLNQANPPWVDVEVLEAADERSNLEDLRAAVEQYRGDFLDGFYLDNAPEFEAWLLARRHELREKWLATLYRLAQREADRQQYSEAIKHAQQLVTLEPLREDGQRLLMTLFAQSGQPAQALTQYEHCTRQLADELGVEPAAETTHLFQQIRDGTFPPSTTAKTQKTNVTHPHNLPAATTSFVGREAELAQLHAWLSAANETGGRLLTIVGPGGVGKTRLALHAAWQSLHGQDFRHGIWYVPLTALNAVSRLATAIAATLNIALSG